MIDIPGYRVLRPLGRGGMASVYLAMQESVQREVALKIMSPTLLGDPQFGERFLREARIAAKLRHPHVVQVHDVGVAGGLHYIAMEYLPGGPVLQRDGPARGLRFALRATREIASALGYAHARGVIHRDIKPDNILLREDGAAVLTDFGIARASDNVRMTMAGAIIGTPSYMSPEQARGMELDGRSDLYSLGIVFYELLLGRVPYTAEDSLTVGIMHITAPLPELPAEHRWLQPVFDRLLAKDPGARFQTGDELAQALAEIEQSLTPTPLRVRPPPPGAFDTAGEPKIGRMDDALADAPTKRRAAAPRPARTLRWIIGLGLFALVLGSAVYALQDRLRGMLPPTQLAAALERADQALAADRLSAADGQGARELYSGVLAVDPENPLARAGLQKVGERWVERARQSLADGDAAGARLALQQARELGLPAATLDAIEQDIRERENRTDVIARWLEAAAVARQSGRIDQGEDNALALYRRILEIDPGNAVALAGRRDVFGELAIRAREKIAAKDFAAAQTQIDAIAAHEPALPELPELRARLAEAQQQQQGDMTAALVRADGLLKRGRLLAPPGDNAAEAYRAVLAVDPANSRAQQGLRQVGQALLQQAGKFAADYEFDRAEALLAQAAELGVGERERAALRSRIDDGRRRQQTLALAAAEQRSPERLRALLAQAQRAADNGLLLEPPGDSAYDVYKRVLSLDPDNAEARAGMARLPAEARRRFEEALGSSRFNTARGYVEALDSLRPDDPALGEIKRRLARAYIGHASERLGAGELANARRAFDAARELDPDNTELPALQARIEQAGG